MTVLCHVSQMLGSLSHHPMLSGLIPWGVPDEFPPQFPVSSSCSYCCLDQEGRECGLPETRQACGDRVEGGNVIVTFSEVTEMIQGQLDFCERQRSLQTHRATLLRNGWLPETRLVGSQVPHWNGPRGLGSWEMCEEDLTPQGLSPLLTALLWSWPATLSSVPRWDTPSCAVLAMCINKPQWPKGSPSVLVCLVGYNEIPQTYKLSPF